MYCNNALVNGEFLPSPSATAGGLQAFSNPDMTIFYSAREHPRQ